MTSHLQLGAIDVKINTYILPSSAIKGAEYKCIECGNKVILRKGSVRKPHFAHYAQTNTCHYYDHPNEAQIHKDAKMLMSQILKDKKNILFTWKCKLCNGYDGLENYDSSIIYKNDDNVFTEYRSKDNKWIADVAIINNNEVRYIIEIKNTHTTVTDRPEPWYEVNAKELIEIVNNTNEECIKDNQKEREKDPLHIDFEYSYIVPCIRNINRYCYGSFCHNESWVDTIPKYDKMQENNSCILCKINEYTLLNDGCFHNFKNGIPRVCDDCLLKESYEKKLRNIYNNEDNNLHDSIINNTITKWDLYDKLQILINLDGGMSRIRKHSKPCISCNKVEYQALKRSGKYRIYYSLCINCFNDELSVVKLIKKLNIQPRLYDNLRVFKTGNIDKPKDIPVSENDILLKTPKLLSKAGRNQKWKQEISCISCNKESYNPVYNNNIFYAICQLCLADPTIRIDTNKKIQNNTIINEPKCMIRFE